MGSGFIPGAWSPPDAQRNSLADVVRRNFTDGQLIALAEVMTPPENARTWIQMDGKVLQAYKHRVQIEGNHVFYRCSVDVAGYQLIPHTFQYGVDAFDFESDALHVAREYVAKQLAYYLAMGEEIDTRQQALSERFQNEPP
jgi:hypothetical protein